MASAATPLTVPVPLTPLIGRRRELETVCALLAHDGARLVTITGPGGVGKTRLAIETALTPEAGARFAEVVFVSLAAVREAEHVIPRIAQALGVQNLGDQPPVEQLVRALATRQLLLILDNLEHLLASVPQLARLLSGCPGLTMLATSREVLRVRGERELAIAPLALPDPSATLSHVDALEHEAVALFTQRAQAALPDFELTAENVPAVVQICQRLDGLPLAIELAAARVKLLPPHGLLARLDHRLTLLTGGARDLPERHQTLRATLDWSYALLSAPEQQLLRGLAIFPAGCTLDAAETVLEPLPDLAVLDGLASLLDKSLLVRAAQADGTPRYHLLETVREYAAEQLAARGESDALHRSLTDWGLTLFAADFSLTHYTVLPRVTAELDNLRAAIEWGHERYPPARQLARSLTWNYIMRGLQHDAALLAESTRTAARDDPPQARAEQFWLRSAVAYAQHDYARSLEYAAQGEALATREMTPMFLIGRGIVAHFRGEYAIAEAMFTQAVESLVEPAQTPTANGARTFLAMTLFRAGKLDRAAAVANEALAVARTCGDDWSAAMAVFTLARVARDRGDAAGALAAFVDSARLSWATQDVRQAAACLVRIAVLAARHEQPAVAVTLLAVATKFANWSGNVPTAEGLRSREQTRADLRQRLPAETFEAALQAGQAMTIATAIALAATLTLPARPAAPTPYGLSPRELEILGLLVDGRSSPAIAEQLFISPRTVTTHVTNIFNKLGVNSRAAAVALALRQGLV